jgi:hypothetical protein
LDDITGVLLISWLEESESFAVHELTKELKESVVLVFETSRFGEDGISLWKGTHPDDGIIPLAGLVHDQLQLPALLVHVPRVGYLWIAL